MLVTINKVDLAKFFSVPVEQNTGLDSRTEQFKGNKSSCDKASTF